MTHSLIEADRTAHLKIASVALAAAVAVVVVGASARLAERGAPTARLQAPVLKAGKPVHLSARDPTAMR
jgi:hypothetical protein